jgi:hypothetical protein
MTTSRSVRGYRPHTVRDQLRFLANPARLRVPAHNVLTRIQDHTPGEQLLGTALALMAMCETANVNLFDVLQITANVMQDAEAPFTSHIQAVRDYAAGELLRGDEYGGVRR